MKKLGFVILAIVGVGGAYYLWSHRPTVFVPGGANVPPPRNVTPIALTGTPQEQEAQIRQYTSRAQADMRSMTSGLEAFYIDHNVYPERLSQLTTPIAYFSQILLDPFTVGDAYGYFKIGDADWIVWSIGPNLKDDGGDLSGQTAGDLSRRKPPFVE